MSVYDKWNPSKYANMITELVLARIHNCVKHRPTCCILILDFFFFYLLSCKPKIYVQDLMLQLLKILFYDYCTF